MHYRVTPREILKSLSTAVNQLGIAKPLHVHCNNLGAAGNFETTLNTCLLYTSKQAKYAVFTWVAKDLNFPHAELTIQNITETVAILNNSTRAAGLALGGSDGDTSANYTNTWLSGLALNDNPIAVSYTHLDVYKRQGLLNGGGIFVGLKLLTQSTASCSMGSVSYTHLDVYKRQP